MAESLGNRSVGCLLTGMGTDGAMGLLSIRATGGLTFAQDQATSVIFGMPAQAMRIGAAERELPLGEIGAALASALLEPSRQP
jgi:two-component system chemotaxis response regulator CheB